MKKYVKRIMRVSRYLITFSFAHICAFVLKAVNKKYRNVWIISERGDDARDNGFFFYKYLVEKCSDINIYYVIAPSSADFQKIKKTGKWVATNSFRHYILFCCASVRLSSSMLGGDIPLPSYYQKLEFLFSKKRKFVYLQHGVSKDYDPSYMADIFHPDLFIFGAYPEYIYYKENYHHPDKVMQYTGFARFDNLHDVQIKNQILVMPTFRKWLQGKDWETVEESEYVSRYIRLLNDERLASLLEQYQLELVFYPHYVMQPYVDLFSSGCDHIKIARFADYDVQQLLIESKLLVTDFSSVFFDFGYMEKPTVYYQFDRERYIREHYDFTKGYFSYDRDGFGEVIYDHDALIDLIESYIRQNFVLSDTYAQRIDKFFPLKDTHNCDRIYERIMELLKK